MTNHSSEQTYSRLWIAHLPKLHSKNRRNQITVYRSAFCNVIFNIAEVDYPDRWPGAIEEVAGRLKSNDENILISGLPALNNIIHAYEFHIEDNLSAAPYSKCKRFFPILEVIMSNIAQSSSPNQIQIMHLISKIFSKPTT